jgi:hypothetical protein
MGRPEHAMLLLFSSLDETGDSRTESKVLVRPLLGEAGM